MQMTKIMRNVDISQIVSSFGRGGLKKIAYLKTLFIKMCGCQLSEKTPKEQPIAPYWLFRNQQRLVDAIFGRLSSTLSFVFSLPLFMK